MTQIQTLSCSIGAQSDSCLCVSTENGQALLPNAHGAEQPSGAEELGYETAGFEDHPTSTSTSGTRSERSYNSAIRRKRPANSALSAWARQRHRQFPRKADGVFIRASLPKPNTSCIGYTTASATD